MNNVNIRWPVRILLVVWSKAGGAAGAGTILAWTLLTLTVLKYVYPTFLPYDTRDDSLRDGNTTLSSLIHHNRHQHHHEKQRQQQHHQQHQQQHHQHQRQQHLHQQQHEQQQQKHHVSKDVNVELNSTQYNIPGISHLERLKLVHKACNKRDLLENPLYRGKHMATYLYSGKYKFNICKVPKIGSTFWSQVFPVLESSRDVHAQSVDLHVSRLHVHNKALSSYSVYFNSAVRRNSKSILVARNPYTRLFSAFIDKSYLPGLPGLNKNIRDYIQSTYNRSINCHNDVTFQDFLDYVIGTARAGGTHNTHWAPVFSLCHPCDVNAFIVVRQETFDADVKHALTQIGVTGTTRNAILKMLHSGRAGATIPGVVRETIERAASDTSIVTCPGWTELAARIWQTFQAQGFIDVKRELPVGKVRPGNTEAFKVYLIDTILDSILRFPLTPEGSRRQRNNALEVAYRTIRNDTVQWIQDVYRPDFELFGYSYTPPGGESP